LHALDLIEYKVGAARVSQIVYLEKHAEILAQDCWLIERFGNLATFRKRLAEADTLIYVDRPIWEHGWWVLKRFYLALSGDQKVGSEWSPMVRSAITSWTNPFSWKERMDARIPRKN
jgi:hypothetical protein